MNKVYQSYEEFWPFYLSQHRNKTCRTLHFVGTHFVLFFGLMSIFQDFRFMALMPLMGYGFAWVGHFVFEKNKPATFTYPLWSLRADFHMWWLLWSRKLNFTPDKDPA